MRHLLLAAILSTSLLLSHTAVQAQDKGLDEFEAFRNKLTVNKTASNDEKEDADFIPADAQSQIIKTPEEYLADANAGDPAAMIEMGRIYREGAEGVSKDLVRALKWYGLAYQLLQAGSREGKQVDANTETEATKWRIYLRNNMQRADIDEAAQLIKNWMPVAPTDAASSNAQAELMFDGMILADSEITAVTVFADRATVTRRAIVNIPQGAQTVVFRGLPQQLIQESLRAKGKAEAVVKLGAVSFKPVSSRKPTPRAPRNMTSVIQPLSDQLLALNAENTALQSKKEFLERVIQQATGTVPDRASAIPDLKPDQWIATANRLYEEMAQIQKSFVAIEVKSKKLQRQIADAQAVPPPVAEPPVTRSNAVLIPLESDEATKLTLELSYQVSNATWEPLYDARLSDDGKLDIVQFGKVRQMTGEDWKGVELTLSTARPQRTTALPELGTVWLNAYERAAATSGELRNRAGQAIEDEVYRKAIEAENAANTRRAMARGGSAMPISIGGTQSEQLSVPPPSPAASGDPLAEWRQKAEARRLSLEADFRPAQINTGGFVTEYKIAGPARVLSDGSDTRLMVGKFDADTDVQVHVKPQLSSDAFIVAQMKLKGDSPLLPGAVNLFRDEAYIGLTNIPLLRPGEEYALYFGIDDQVSVKRSTVKDNKKEEGVIRKDNIIERQYVTQIQNLHSTPVTVLVSDIVPASQNDKVTIDIRKDFTTAGFTADAKDVKGRMDWKFDMSPKDKKEIKLGWTVTWPEGFILQGL